MTQVDPKFAKITKTIPKTTYNDPKRDKSHQNKTKRFKVRLNPIQDRGRRQNSPNTSFSPVTSTNVRFRPQNFLTFIFNLFATLVQNFKFVPSAALKLLNLDQDHALKKQFLGSNSYKIEVMITFFIEMVQLPNFGYMTTSII